MFGDNRTEMRRMFSESWGKLLARQPMTPLEQMIAKVVQQHPEYQHLLEDPEKALERDFLPEGGETNPFLHMGMHIGLREQFGSDRPPGIHGLYRKLVSRTSDPHEAEHQMMECLGRVLWEAQRDGGLPDEQRYLDCVEALCRG